MKNEQQLKFIDLFSGIGGFHQAIRNLGGKCVLSSEIDEYAIETYEKNYHIKSAGDVKKIDINDIPEHDVLCAGFPCQTFSKAGKQEGFKDQVKGTLFFEIVRILESKKPKYIILENVRNLISHDKGNTWKIIKESLREFGYNFKEIIMSPHQLGIPQLRERIYILGVNKDFYEKELKFEIPKGNKEVLNTYESKIFDKNVLEKYKISEHEKKLLDCWDEFYKGINLKVIGFPVWAQEFRNKKSLDDLPKWKKNFCLKNRKLYIENKKFIDSWLKKWNNLEEFTNTEKKLEWQAGKDIETIWDGYIQIRPSGVRVKRPTSFPALVAMVQIPIIGKYKRRLTPREAARLQSFPENFIINENDFQAYKQFGNAVNVNCVEFLANQLFIQTKKNERKHMEEQKKNEQIAIDMKVIDDYDQPIRKVSEIVGIYEEIFGKENCGIENYENKKIYFYENNNVKHYFLTASVTWLGNPHPSFKKRLQLKNWYKDFYQKNKDKNNIKIHLIGLYHYEKNIIFVEFKLQDYIDKEMNNSSAHVYSNDLYQAMINPYFTKKDTKNNTITTITKKNFKNYIEDNLEEYAIQKIFDKFNQKFQFCEWIKADNAIKEMKENNWYSWKQAEWAGWFLEYKVDKFLKEENYQKIVIYVGDQKNSNYDFDLYFKEDIFYGDLKASDISKKEVLGNDKKNVVEVIKKYKKLWYIIYEHQTKKDIDHNSEMAIERMKLIGKEYKEGEEISYKERMKHSVKFEKMRIIEVNEINMNYILQDFQQGRQPTGEKRNVKIKINKNYLDNFLIFSYKANSEGK